MEPPVVECAEPFWEATREQRLVLPWCTDCNQPFWYPREVCPRCLGSAIEWRPALGTGVVYAVVTEHRLREGQRPHAVALVDLPEGVRVLSNVVGPAGAADESFDATSVRIGQSVTAAWEPLSDGRNLLLFTPA